MTRKLLPIGVQDFRTIRSEPFYYVDKTPLIRRLVSEGMHYFLSRPRRFGKSLLIDTIKALFEGQEHLFEGLDIHPHWDWSAPPNPVLRLSFDGTYAEPTEVDKDIVEQLESVERTYDLSPARTSDTGPLRLRNVLDRLHRATGQRVVVLVDEYDKPILDTLRDPERAEANRAYLRGVYGIIKGSAEHIRFTFLTGVSMFSRGTMFSGLNNLKNISLDPRFATICGYMGKDIDTVFAPELEGLDRDEIRRWYNGYNWGGDARVYNPYDVLLLLDGRKFKPYWFETGTLNFLFDTLIEQSVSPMELEGRMQDISPLSTFDINNIDLEALMFQAGYLTIAETHMGDEEEFYQLDYPNHEVRVSLNRGLLAKLGKTGREPQKQGRELCALLAAGDFGAFRETLGAWLSGIPYQWHIKNDLARYEAWYASLFYMALRAAGADLKLEEASSHGRADMVVTTGGQIFVVEFKVAETEADGAAAMDAALTQMRDRGYAEKYRANDMAVHLVGVVCGRETRTLLDVRVERT